MKMMKLALLGGAAFAVMTAGAQADDLSALKAEIEALNARVAQLEASPSVPDGYQLMTYSKQNATVVPGNESSYVGKNSMEKGYNRTAHAIGILPAADAPATTTIEWSGYVYAIVVATDYGYYETAGSPAILAAPGIADDPLTPFIDETTAPVAARAAIPGVKGNTDVNVVTRAQLKVVGKTDTAVGEVGVRVQLRSSNPGVEGDRSFFANEYWGWWAMTPELTIGGGYSGSLGNIGYGMDGACNCWYTDWFSSSSSSYRNGSFDGTYDPGDAPQIRLSWASGPISAAIALEDSNAAGNLGGRGRTYFGGFQDDLAVAGEIKFSGETINGEISAIAYESDSIVNNHNDNWQVGAGIGFALGSIANISLAAAAGQEPVRGDYWGASGLVGFTLTDTVGFEVGANWKSFDDISGDNDLLEVLAGIYYNPVSQLTFGLEAEWADTPSGDTADGFSGDDLTTFDFVSIWRF
jgi:hypothetical protein